MDRKFTVVLEQLVMKPIVCRLRWILLATLLFAGVAHEASAQSRGNVTVQLPTFHQFGVSTTVVVPDQGSLYLGGVNRSSLGSSSFGPGVSGLGTRGRGRTSMGSGLSISATIIDHDEIDRALLAEAARRRGAAVDMHGRPVTDAPSLSPAVVGQQTLGQEVVGRRAARARDGRNSLALPRYRQNARHTSGTNAEQAEMYLQRAERAEASGEPHQAIIFYQRVVKHAGPSLKKQAQQRLAHLKAITKR